MNDTSERLCSHCRFPIHENTTELRHYGTHTAHQENECLRLMQAEIDRLRAELAEWRKLRDPVVLHVNLLRGIPAQMTREQIWHLAANDRDRLAELEAAAKHEADCAEAFKAEAAGLRVDRDMLRDALAALVVAVDAMGGDLPIAAWHALEDARQALAQMANAQHKGPRSGPA